MSDGAELAFDDAAFDKAGRSITRRYRSAAQTVVREQTRELEHRLEEVTRASAPGKLWRAWKSRFYQNSGGDPAGIVYLNGGERTRGALTFWSEPGEIRGKRGQYLAIPLPAAGARGRARDLTPGEWERAHGVRLQFVYRQGKPSLLVAPGGTTNGRSGAFRPLTGGTRGRAAQGRGGANPLYSSVVPIFVLIAAVSFRNAVAIDPVLAGAEGNLVRGFLAAIGSTNS